MEPIRFQYDLDGCGLSRALAILGEKWTLLVVREAFYGVRRFDDFARALGCGRAVLSDRLKTLTESGVLRRAEYREGDQRPRAEYRLTDKGRDLYPALLALSQWGDQWEPSPDGPVAQVTDRGSGRTVRAIITADEGARALGVRDLLIAPGPGARRL